MKKYIKSSRITDRDDWFELWCDDKESIIDIMRSNIEDDLNAGYDPNGKSIRTSKTELSHYEDDYYKTLDMFKGMNPKEVNNWCFYDMKKRGAID